MEYTFSMTLKDSNGLTRKQRRRLRRRARDQQEDRLTVKTGLPRGYWNQLNRAPEPEKVAIVGDNSHAVLVWTMLGVAIAALTLAYTFFA